MQLHDLPDDVLRLVLEASFAPRVNSIAPTLKANLPLLAVCRRWRHLALATVYSDVAVCYGSKPSYSSDSDDGHANNTTDEPDDAEIATSLDLVVAADCVQMVKRVEIVVNYKLNPFPGLSAVIRLMRAAAEEWRGVRQLDISIPSTESTIGPEINAAGYSERTKQTSAALAATMPGIRCVVFSGCYVNSVIQKFDGELAAIYSDQLESLHSYHPISVPPGHTFKQLRDVSTWYDGVINHQHPRVDPARLVSLDLVSWPINHSWTAFNPDGHPGAIVFLNLKELTVIYWPTDVVDGVEARYPDGHPWKLHFPKLSKLHVSCKLDVCPLLEYAVLPPRMNEISIEATAPVLVRVAETGLPAPRSLRVSIMRSSNSNPAALAAANRILESAQEGKERFLKVYDESIPVLPESITCTLLTALSIDADTSVDTALGLIRILPNLGSLYIWRLTLHDIQEDISVPGPDEDCRVEPFNARVKEMSIEASLDGRRPEMLVPAAKYLLLRMPALVRLCSGDIPRRPIAEFVSAYSNRYPHLAGVEYALEYDCH